MLNPERPSRRFVTHEVTNQAPPLSDFNAWQDDDILQAAVRHYGADWAIPDLDAYGALSGGELYELGDAANRNRPVLRTFDRYGHRIDEVDFHPAYHRIMELAVRHGVSHYAWRHEGRPGAHVARIALTYLHNQAEQGTSCPLTMTSACVPALRKHPEIASRWLPHLLGSNYDPRSLPVDQKRAVLIGMGMTEKQGGSDVRANTTQALPGGEGAYELVGHKWFFSVPTADAHLVTAYADDALSCFLVPRILDDGSPNNVRIQRLKDKIGDWSNASSEVEFQGALAFPIGPIGRGIATILEMVMLTRLDCMAGSAAIMRQALRHAVHHCQHRKAFGKRLIDQPLMQSVLAELTADSASATALTMRVAAAVDASAHDPQQAAFAKLATAVGKYWICKRCVSFVNEAQECLGGQGYVEESIMARLYRQAPLNSIWEGSGNVQCLDVLRTLGKEPDLIAIVAAETAAARRSIPAMQCSFESLPDLIDGESAQANARRIAGRLAQLLEVSVLLAMGQSATAHMVSQVRTS